MDTLPYDILHLLCIEYISISDILNLSIINKTMNTRLQSVNLWSRLYKQNISSCNNNITIKDYINIMREYNSKKDDKLIYSSSKGYNILVKKCLNCGYNIYYKNCKPLRSAIDNNHKEILKLFLENDYYITNLNVYICYWLVCNNYKSIVTSLHKLRNDLIKNDDDIKYLIEYYNNVKSIFKQNKIDINKLDD